MKLSEKIKSIAEDLGIDLENCKDSNCEMCPFKDADILDSFPITISILERLENVAEKYVFKSDLAKNLKVDDAILVSGDGTRWDKAHFAKFENGIFYVWEHGRTSFTTNETYAYNFAKLPRKKFDWEEFKKGKIAVNCKTEELAKDFLKQADEQGIKWYCGDEATIWEDYKENMCYRVYDGCTLGYSDTAYYERKGYKIVDWEDCI